MSSSPYPQDRVRARQDQAGQPYQDAKEAVTQGDARLQAQAETEGEARAAEADEERGVRVTAEAQERFREIGDEVREESGDDRRGDGLAAPGQPD